MAVHGGRVWGSPFGCFWGRGVCGGEGFVGECGGVAGLLCVSGGEGWCRGSVEGEGVLWHGGVLCVCLLEGSEGGW